MWLAFEAVKCAERQGMDLADELDWAIRSAFFVESRCIAMHHVLFERAEQVGLDIERFSKDFDSGVAKRLVLEEARDGWERLRVAGSPTFVLPSGTQYSGLGLPEVELDDERYHCVIGLRPAPCTGSDCLDLYAGCSLRPGMDRDVGGSSFLRRLLPRWRRTAGTDGRAAAWNWHPGAVRSTGCLLVV
jgi:hypothetical protein